MSRRNLAEYIPGGGGTVYDYGITLPATSGLTPGSQAVFGASLGLAGVSVMSPAGPGVFDRPIILPGTTGLVLVGGKDVLGTLTLAGTSGLTPSNVATLQAALTMAGTSGLAASYALAIAKALAVILSLNSMIERSSLMPLKNVAIILQYVAWDTVNNVGKTGDVGNHTIKLVRDGVVAIPTNTPVEVDATNCPGIYKLSLIASEMNCNVVTLAGKSSATGVSIIPITVTTEGGLLSKTSVENGGKIDSILNQVSGGGGIV